MFFFILHSDEAEDIWKHFLTRDFLFTFNNGNDDPNSLVYYRKTLRVAPDRPSHENRRDSPATSIFGYDASNGVFLSESSYQSWRQWNIAKRRYFEGCKDINERKMNAPCMYYTILL